MKRLIPLQIVFLIILTLTFLPVDTSGAKDNKSGDAPRITIEELKSMLGNPNLVILDNLVGDQWETVDQKLPGAIHEDPDKVDTWAERYPKDKIYVTYCA